MAVRGPIASKRPPSRNERVFGSAVTEIQTPYRVGWLSDRSNNSGEVRFRFVRTSRATDHRSRRSTRLEGVNWGAGGQYSLIVDDVDESVANGDDTAHGPSSERGWDEFAPLYDDHHERLYRIAVLLCNGRTHMAEDAVAETFINVYQAWAGGGIEDFAAYARRALVNHITGQGRREQVASRYLTRHSKSDVIQDAAEDRVVDTAQTFELLAQLPPRQRAAIVLRFYEDLPYDQIASELGVSVGTVKAQVSTGLQRLRINLGNEDPEP